MFTFSPGFEAATLKIPNKEYTSYGARGYQGYNGSNDPYNLVTVNQGGVVVDGGRDGTMSSWPAPGDDGTGGHFVANGGSQGTRKQIIGFAKFKSRDYALEARDVLQGRRVDIEKGAVLKAEMAKKNLHTKRGVGPVAGPALTGPPPPPNQLQNVPHLNGVSIGPHLQDPFAPNDPYARPDAIDLARPGAWRDQLQRDVHAVTNGISSSYPELHLREEEELRTRRERESSLYSAMGFPSAVGSGSTTRGPRERAEEEERRRKEKESLRVSTSSAFDAFHSVPIGAPPPLSRHNSGLNGVSLMPPPMEPGSGLGSSPHLASAFAAAPNVNQQSAFNAQHHEELAGPWDHVPVSASRSSSQRSTSPEDSHETRFSPPGEGSGYDRTPNRTKSESSSSSVAGSHSQGILAGPGSDDNDIDLAKVMNELVLNTDNGTTSPQLPSPASGASSRNAVDQNPPVSTMIVLSCSCFSPLPQINTLYVGNLPTSPAPLGYPPEYLEDAIRQLFSQQPGYRRLCYRQKNNGPMCFVEVGTSIKVSIQ